MAAHRYCKHCGKRFMVKRNPQQHYCSDKRCQEHRKTLWRKAKMKNDVDYQANQKIANKCWQSNHTHYWRQYRAKHPDYVERNRKAQRVRDESARLKASPLAKSDALAEKTLRLAGTYWLTAATEDPLAKSDALLVKILVQSGQNGYETHLAKR